MPARARPPYDWTRFDRSHFRTEAQIGEWVPTTCHEVMYRDAQNVD